MPRLLRRWTIFIFLSVAIVYSVLRFTHVGQWPSLLHKSGKFLDNSDTTYSGPRRDAFRKWLEIPLRFPPKNLRKLPEGPPVEIPRVQHDIKWYKESPRHRQERERRREVVKEAFRHSWNGYREYAWLHDEVKPVSGKVDNQFCGWGATLVDSLDTLWIMGLERDFAQAVASLKQVDFTKCEISSLSVFETTIRYLGGLLGAYDIRNGKYPALLQKAMELGEMLYHAFDTKNRMPIAHWDWKKAESQKEEQEVSEMVLVAELGSLSLEFTRLAQLTSDNKYFDAIQKVMELFQKEQNNTAIPGLWPVFVDPKNEDLHGDNTYTFGGMADSVYEYLPKQYLLLGGRLDMYKDMYHISIEAAKNHLAFEPLIPLQNEKARPTMQNLPPRKDHQLKRRSTYSFEPDYINPIIFGTARMVHEEIEFKPEGQHLTCFAGGMAGLAARAFRNMESTDEDMALAERLTAGCVWSYKATATGIGPEVWQMHPCRKGRAAISSGAESDWLGKRGKCVWDREKWLKGVKALEQQKDDDRASDDEDPERWDRFVKENGLHEGFTEIRDKRYMLRPEAIESVFYMWRFTGDTKYQEQAWTMFTAITNLTRTSIAYSGIQDVNADVEAPPLPAAPANPTQTSKPEQSGTPEDTSVTDKETKDTGVNPQKKVNQLTRRLAAAMPFPKSSKKQDRGSAMPKNKPPPKLTDRMESFWTAETLKYFYLIFADPDVCSLDEFILNTEAHPFRWRQRRDVPGLEDEAKSQEVLADGRIDWTKMKGPIGEGAAKAEKALPKKKVNKKGFAWLSGG